MPDWPHTEDKFSEEDFLAFLVVAGPPPTEYNTLYRTAMLRARMEYIGQADAFCLDYFGGTQRAFHFLPLAFPGIRRSVSARRATRMCADKTTHPCRSQTANGLIHTYKNHIRSSA